MVLSFVRAPGGSNDDAYDDAGNSANDANGKLDIHTNDGVESVDANDYAKTNSLNLFSDSVTDREYDSLVSKLEIEEIEETKDNKKTIKTQKEMMMLMRSMNK